MSSAEVPYTERAGSQLIARPGSCQRAPGAHVRLLLRTNVDILGLRRFPMATTGNGALWTDTAAGLAETTARICITVDVSHSIIFGGIACPSLCQHSCREKGFVFVRLHLVRC